MNESRRRLLMALGFAVAWALVACVCVSALRMHARESGPPKAENPYPQFPLFSVHWELCPQCHAPLINEKGEESPGFCEMGFKLLQEDVRNSKR